jgi:transcriptional regulator GlxA family with amidase domain
LLANEQFVIPNLFRDNKQSSLVMLKQAQHGETMVGTCLGFFSLAGKSPASFL